MQKEFTTDEWLELIRDKEIFRPDDLFVFQCLSDAKNHTAYASELGLKLAQRHGKTWKQPAGPVNLLVGALAKRIIKKRHHQKRPVLPIVHYNEIEYWPLFFIGWWEKKSGDKKGRLFAWQLRPNLIAALEKYRAQS